MIREVVEPSSNEDLLNIIECYCIKDKRVTPCVEPYGFQKDRMGRTQFFSKCGECGYRKIRYVDKNFLTRCGECGNIKVIYDRY